MQTKNLLAFPLSKAQNRLWILSNFSKANVAYNMVGVIHLEGNFDQKLFERVILDLTERHEILRTTFNEVDGKVCSVIHDSIASPVSYCSFRQHKNLELGHLIEDMVQHNFNLEKGPLLKVKVVELSDAKYAVIINMHHIISDGWSLKIFINESSELYNAYLSGTTPLLPELEIQHADYVVWEEKQTDSNQKSLDFWTKYLESPCENSTFPLQYQRSSIQSFDGALYQRTIPSEFTEKIRNTASRLGITPFTVMFSAYNLLLHKYTNQTDIITGTPIANRDIEETHNIIGFFVSTLPIRSKIQSDLSIKHYIKTLQEECAKAFDHKNVPLDEIVNKIKIQKHANRNPLFQTVFSYENIEQKPLNFKGVNAYIEQIEGYYSKFDLTFSVKKNGAETLISIEYARQLFDEQYMEILVDCYLNTLQFVTDFYDNSVASFSVVPELLREKIHTWNNTDVPYKDIPTVGQLLEEQVKQHPLKVAYCTSEVEFTYSELFKKVNTIASLFEEEGLKKNDLVALLLSRDQHLLPAMLACLKTGVAYIPLDPSYPEKRLEYILKHAGLAHIVTNIKDKLSIETEAYKIIDVTDTSHANESNSTCDVTPEDTAYIIYTSGSTGQPKGVEVSNMALSNFLLSMKNKPRMDRDDNLLALTSTSFDISGLELFLPVISGGTVVLADENQAKNPDHIINLIEKFDISVIQATPTTWRLLKEIDWQGNKRLKALIGGEPVPSDVVKWLLSVTKEAWNMYGPTETTIWSTIHKFQDSDNIVKIGRPVNNTQVFILDNDDQPVPPFTVANLYIGGAGLAKGYYKDKEKTEQLFRNLIIDDVSRRLYKTGDLAYYLPEGDLVHQGRTDFQVKVDGYRIELDEINFALQKHKDIIQAYCIVTSADNGNKIIAYLRSRKKDIFVEAIRNHLQESLPAYMLPREYRIIDEFPLTPNGKIDHKKIVQTVHTRISNKKYIAPKSAQEKTIAAIWQEILGMEKVGLDDNFFDLGGASVQSVKIASKALKKGLMIKPEQLFEFPTVRQLADKAEAITGVSTGSSYIDQEELKMSDELVYNPDSDDKIPTELNSKNLLIESIAHYQPSKSISSRELIEGCKNKVRFPMERLTGIHRVDVAGEDEGSFELAVNAVDKCFNISKYRAEDIDLIISCNIFRMSSDTNIEVDPGLSIRVKKHFNCVNAITYDISNACSGVFTGLMLADNFIKANKGKRCLIVSGEFLSHVVRTTQREVIDYLDLRISGLTGGDSGLAMVVEHTSNSNVGFKHLDFFTMGAYSDLCIIKNSPEKTGGMIINTDAIRMAEAGHLEGAKHTLKALKSTRWTPEMIDYIIMHQASSTTITNAMSEMNKLFGRQLTHDENVINNLRNRGNTATTTHWIATLDNIRNGKISQGKNMVYFISGSGLNLGTGLYVFDDLPERIKAQEENGHKSEKVSPSDEVSYDSPSSTIAIDAVGVSNFNSNENGMDLLKLAGEGAIRKSGYDKDDIDTIIYTGVHRDEYTYEPSIGTMLAGMLEINSSVNLVQTGKKSVALDIYNGDLGFLNACFAAQTLIQSGAKDNVLIALSEIDNNKRYGYDSSFRIKEAGAAAIVKKVAWHEDKGFKHFSFKSDVDVMDHYQSKATIHGPKVKLETYESNALTEKWIALILDCIDDLMEKSNVTLNEINHIIPPQRGLEFASRFKAAINHFNGQMHSLEDNLDYKGMSIPFCIEKGLEQNKFQAGDKAIFIGISGGLQAGAVLYNF